MSKKEQRKEEKRKKHGKVSVARPTPHLSPKPFILIVCEGQNTEPSYFRQFRLSSADIAPIGVGYNTVSLVEKAEALSKKKHYDQIWCVFDKDAFSEANFNNAIQKAESLGFGVAYSNQAFEYWLLLHFDDHQGGKMDRKLYNERINRLIAPFRVTYDGNGSKTVSSDFFDLLDGKDAKTGKKRVDLAKQRAKRNLHQHGGHNPAQEESSTTVFRLVEEILKYL
jgi:hypothetical protein